MPVKSAVPLRVDQHLTNFSRQYSNHELIWMFVMPLFKVNQLSDKYWIYDHEKGWMLPDDTLGANSYANLAIRGVKDGNYSVVDHGLEDWESASKVDDAPSMPLLLDMAENVDYQLHLLHEKRVADIAFLAANYPAAYKVQLSGTDQWSDTANSDPVVDVNLALATPIQRPNTLVFGHDAWEKFRVHPKVLAGIARFKEGFATKQEVAALFEVERIVVGDAQYNSAKEGQTPVMARIWNAKHFAALYVRQNPGRKSVTWGATFSEMNFTTYRGFDPRRGTKGSHWVKTAWNSDEKIIADAAGYFIEDAVA